MTRLCVGSLSLVRHGEFVEPQRLCDSVLKHHFRRALQLLGHHSIALDPVRADDDPFGSGNPFG